MKTLILGLGNPILSDDSVGLRVAEFLKGKLTDRDTTVIESNSSGLGLLDILIGYDQAIIIDAIQTEGDKIGEIYHFKVEDFKAGSYMVSSHGINLAAVLELGEKLGLTLPQDFDIIAVGIPRECPFGEECTPEVQRAIPLAAEVVIKKISIQQ